MTDEAAAWPALPVPRNAKGNPRLVGVEIEFAGLTEDAAARLIARELGGTARKDARMVWKVKRTVIGSVTVELDTVLRKGLQGEVLEGGLNLARGLIPVEIVTQPLDREGLVKLEGLVAALRRAGAVGSAQGVLLGFGVHFNVEVVSPEAAHTARTVQAYGLLEPVLRAMQPVDPTRRLMPFVRPWPDGLTAELAALPAEITAQRAAYARHVDSRNHGLDLLPLFKAMDEEIYADLFPGHGDIKGRPAYHFRLPDSRIDEDDWSLAREWTRWRLTEMVAADETLLQHLVDARRAHDRDDAPVGEWVATARAALPEGWGAA